jgi:predicted phosphodiesterase
MRIVVITDVHANLPALKAALESIRAEGYDALFHTGDAIGIGPHPAECLDLLLNTPNIRFVIGNHEAYFINDLPVPTPTWMSEGEVQHQHWTHSRLDPQLRLVLGEWPYVLDDDFDGVRTAFVHYGLDQSGQEFQPFVKDAQATDLERMFSAQDVTLLFYGHNHHKSDVMGRARYVNPGSLGYYSQAIARYCVVEFQRGQYTVDHRQVPYDDTELFGAFEQWEVPERAFIYRAFFGGRSRAEKGGDV